MTTPITLPCTIPGLLRVGSSVWVQRNPSSVVQILAYRDDGSGVLTHVGIINHDVFVWIQPERMGLDLSDPTSRVHAAWWVCGQGGGISEDEQVILMAAKNGLTMGPTAQAQLRDMVLRRVKA